MELVDLIKDLKAKAEKAKSCGPLLPDNLDRAGAAYDELLGSCSPETILRLCEALEEANAALEFYAKTKNTLHFFGLAKDYGPGTAAELYTGPAKTWLTKYGKEEGGDE